MGSEMCIRDRLVTREDLSTLPYSVNAILELKKTTSRFKRTYNKAYPIYDSLSASDVELGSVEKLLTEDVYKDLPDKLNLVIVPMENVDGAAIHYELQKEHPTWKFHVARFNSLGKEFYYEHFQQDTIHSEAMGLTRIYDRYVPDMIVDNHGVPSLSLIHISEPTRP